MHQTEEIQAQSESQQCKHKESQYITWNREEGGTRIGASWSSLKFQLPSWNRRGGAKRRGGSQVEIFSDYSYHPPSLDVGSASRFRCPIFPWWLCPTGLALAAARVPGGQFVQPHFKLDYYLLTQPIPSFHCDLARIIRSLICFDRRQEFG